jgi:hypothetical protein
MRGAALVKERKCKVQSAKCKVQSAKCKMQNAKCKMQNEKWFRFQTPRGFAGFPIFHFALCISGLPLARDGGITAKKCMTASNAPHAAARIFAPLPQMLHCLLRRRAASSLQFFNLSCCKQSPPEVWTNPMLHPTAI